MRKLKKLFGCFCVIIITVVAILGGKKIAVLADEMITEPSYDDGYMISTKGELLWYINYVNETDNYANARLVKNINMRNGSWSQIGSEERKFAGVFDGNGKKIVGISSTGALFEYSEGTIINLKIESGDICGRDNVSAICRYNYGRIENCSTAVNVYGEKNVAGICGYNDGIISKCYNEGFIKGIDNVAGICGDNYNNIDNCYNLGSITAMGLDEIEETDTNFDSVAGGIATSENSGNVIDSFNAGKVVNNRNTSNVYEITNVGYENCYSTKDDIDFKSGEVAYFLNRECTENVVWGQQIGKDDYPGFNNHIVYKGYEHCTLKYDNKELSAEPVHEFTKEWKVDDNVHYHECIYCEERKDEEEHQLTEFRHQDIKKHVADCIVCNIVISQGHGWGNIIITEMPTEDVNGLGRSECSGCKGKKETEIGLDKEIPILEAVNYIEKQGILFTSNKIEILANDNRSGVSDIYYSFIENDKIIDDNCAENVTWNKYKGIFKYDERDYASLYIKVVDKCNNYIITDATCAVLLSNNEKGNKYYTVKDIRSYQ